MYKYMYLYIYTYEGRVGDPEMHRSYIIPAKHPNRKNLRIP